MSGVIRIYAHRGARHSQYSREPEMRHEMPFHFELRAEDLPVFSYFSYEGGHPSAASDQPPDRSGV
jgi:hypothetical protein